MRCRALVSLATWIVVAVAAADVGAQQASAFAPPGHWSVDAVQRLQALGLTPPGTQRGEGSRTIQELALIFAHAGRATETQDAYEDLVRGYRLRFQEEFAADSSAAASLTYAWANGGVARRTGAVLPGRYTTWGEENWTGAVPIPDRTRATVGGAFAVRPTPFLAVGAAASRTATGSLLEEAYAVARVGSLALWGGRRRPAYASGVVLSGTAPFDGGGLFLPEPLRLPGILRHLGPVRMELAGGILERNGPVAEPWFVVTRGAIEPHPRFGIAVTRALMIGAEEGRLDVADVLLTLVGKHAGGSEYDNQVAAVDAWLRPPLGRVPLLLYVEWGAEDSAGAWWGVPGIVAGLELPALPGLEQIGVQIERTSFAGSGDGNPPWYRHPIGFHEGWTSRARLLGHPLGGHGEEWRVAARGSSAAGRVQWTGQAFTRYRRAENLLAPERAGRSNGGGIAADVRLHRGLALELSALMEDGAGWARTEGGGGLRLYLPRR